MADLKREKIVLVKNPKEVNEGAEPELEKVWTIPFISLRTTREAVSLYHELYENPDMTDDEKTEKAMDFLCEKAFGGKITKDDINNRLPGPGYNDGADGQELLIQLLLFVASGQQSNDTKNFLAGKK